MAGSLLVKTIRDRSNVVVLFDSGPGIKEPHRVFDPFYSRRSPSAKGRVWVSASASALIQEHAGKIFCYNRQKVAQFSAWNCPQYLAAFPAKDLQTHQHFGETCQAL